MRMQKIAKSFGDDRKSLQAQLFRRRRGEFCDRIGNGIRRDCRNGIRAENAAVWVAPVSDCCESVYGAASLPKSWHTLCPSGSAAESLLAHR